MESEQILKFVEALEHTGSSDNERRRAAETVIESEKTKIGFWQAMMQIASNSSYNEGRAFDVNLAAAIQLKNMADYNWRYGDYQKDIGELDFTDIDEDQPTIKISDADKDFVKTNIIQAMAHAPSIGVLSQLEAIVNIVARYEMPDNWPNAMNEISDLINSENEQQVFAGLVALKEVTKRFEYEFNTKREPLNEIADNLFPTVEKILESVIENYSDDATKVKHVIMKTLFFANQAKICHRYIKNFEVFMNIIYQVLMSTMPEELKQLTEDTEMINKYLKSDHWKMKIECMKLLNKLYGQLWDSELAVEEVQDLSKHFETNYSPKIINLSLEIIKSSAHSYVADQIVSFAIRIIWKSTKTDNGIPQQLKDEFEEILFKTCLPLLKMSPLEVEEFNDNPVSYIREQFDVSDTVNSTKNTAIDMMMYFATYKPDETSKEMPPYLEKFISYLYESFNEYENGHKEDFRIKESIMLALGQLEYELKKYGNILEGINIHSYSNAQDPESSEEGPKVITIESIIKEHIFPELTGENSILRARALWTYSELYMFIKEPEHIVKTVEYVYKSLLDECLPVKVFAGTSLHKLGKLKEAKEILEPGVNEIIGAYLQVMQEIDQDELVNALEEVVNIFDDKIEPFAYELVQQLVSRFKKISKNESDDAGEAMLTANGLICAIRRIIAAVSKRKDIIERIEDEVYPCILFSFTPKGIEYIEDSIDCAILIVYHRQYISEKMWKIFFHMVKIVIGEEKQDPEMDEGGYGFEFLPIMLSFFQNWVSYGGDSFFTFEVEGETPFSILAKSISKIFQIDENLGDSRESSVSAMKLIGTLLENLHGKIDDALGDLISILHKELSQDPPSKIFKSSILQTFSMCFVYSTSLTYLKLSELGHTEFMIEEFMKSLSDMKKTYEIRRWIYGLSWIIKSKSFNILQYYYKYRC